MALRIISLNCSGIADTLKHRIIFNYYKERAKIICLQETHSSRDMEEIWENEFGGTILFSHGETNARGTCICLKKNIMYKLNKVNRDDNGRVVVCELEHRDNPLKKNCLMNIYGSNKD